MKTIPRNEELNASSERMNKRLNDEFIRQQVERYKQEQAQKKQRETEASSAEKSENKSATVSAGTKTP